MKNKIRLLLSLFSLVGLNACIKHPSNSSPCAGREVYLDSYARSLFFNGKSTSYWIYRDSVGNVDSSWINDAFDGPVIPGCAENYVYNLYSSIINNDFNITGAVGKNAPTQVYIIYDFANSSGRGGDDCYQICFLNGAIAMAYDTLFPSITFEQLPTYAVNQYSFSNAVKITSTSGCPVHYIVLIPGIGIVEKWNGHGNSPFKLIKYSI